MVKFFWVSVMAMSTIALTTLVLAAVYAVRCEADYAALANPGQYWIGTSQAFSGSLGLVFVIVGLLIQAQQTRAAASDLLKVKELQGKQVAALEKVATTAHQQHESLRADATVGNVLTLASMRNSLLSSYFVSQGEDRESAKHLAKSADDALAAVINMLAAGDQKEQFKLMVGRFYTEGQAKMVSWSEFERLSRN